MIYEQRPPDVPVDQGDIIDDCPLLSVAGFVAANPESMEVKHAFARVIVMTQTCDLANLKSNRVVVAALLDAAELVASGAVKAADIRGPVRAGRVYGWYFLPKSPELGLPESIVDFRHLQTVPSHVLAALCRIGKRRAHLPSLYREHLSQHFANTYSRIGLPAPYPTD